MSVKLGVNSSSVRRAVLEVRFPTLRPIDQPIRVLVVCTANQCRSPIAVALLERRLSAAGICHAVASAGTRAQAGWPATEDAVAAAAELGLDISSHRSRPLEPGLVAEAHLLIGMTREHTREAATLAPDALARTFTFKELVRRGEAHPRHGEPPADWVATLAAEREIKELLGASATDDVDDPIGLPIRAYRETAALLDDLARRLVRVAWPAHV